MLLMLAVVGVSVFVAGLVVSKGLVWIGLALFLGSVVLILALVAALWRKVGTVRWQEGAVTFRIVRRGYFDHEYGQSLDCKVELSPHGRIVWVQTRVGRVDEKRLVVGATMRCLIDRTELVAFYAFPRAVPDAPLPAGDPGSGRGWGDIEKLQFREGKS
jgi:hypothetical protein